MTKFYPIKGLISLLLIPFAPTVGAELYLSPDSKPNGIGLEWYQHELDMKVTGLDISLPGLPAGLADSVKGQLKAKSEAEIINLRLDRQIRPNLNVFGAIGKVTDTTTVNFDSLATGLSDLVVDNKGTAYSAGATLTGHYGELLPSLHYTHSRIHFDNNEKVVVNMLIPSVGVPTRMGVLSGSLVYQAMEANYAGTVNAPFIGDVPVSVNTKNNDSFQVMAGLNTKLADNLYLNANAGLNGQKQFQIQVNQRF